MNVLYVLLFLNACGLFRSDDGDQIEPVREIVVLYTNDEHGWMEATESTGGAAGMVGLWKGVEGYVADSSFLVLSGGDMWTGPAISTWFQGQSMVEAMNAMGYDAAAIGNHEFDFMVDGLRANLVNSDFPFLSANIREKDTGEIPDFATPWIVKEVNSIQVGIIGLTTTSTPTSTYPEYVKDYYFLDYEEALAEVVPQVKAEGAELMFVIGHICYYEMQALAATAAGLGITLIGGGHCNDRVAELVEGVAVIESGYHLQAYAKAELYFDIDADTLVSIALSTHDNVDGTPDAAVAGVVAYWRQQADVVLSEIIGYVANRIGQYSPAMHNMITDAWLWAFPQNQIALTNTGGIRQYIPAGDITPGTIVGVQPFENSIMEITLAGSQIISYIGEVSCAMGGMTTIGGYYLDDGTPMDDNTTYSVLVNSYMWQASQNLQSYDPDPYDTGVNYRQPVIDWITSLSTSQADPLDNYLDTVARR